MKKDAYLYELLCQNILTDFYTGRIKKGDSLPSIDNYRNQYQLGLITVRLSLQVLVDKNYIKISQGKKAISLFDLEHKKYASQYLKDLYQRKQAVLDICEVLMILAPCLSKNLTKENIVKIKSLLSKLDATKDNQNLEHLNNIFFLVGANYRNPVLSDLLIQLHQFIGVPAYRQFPSFIQVFIKELQTLLLQPTSHTIEKVYYNLSVYFSNYFHFIRPLSVVEKQPVCFTWRVDSSRYSQGELLAAYYMGLIDNFQFQNGHLLASYEMISKKYGVKKEEAKKVFVLLKQYGFAKKENGSYFVNIKKRNAEKLSQKLQLCYFCLHIFSLFCRNLSEQFLFCSDSTQISLLLQKAAQHNWNEYQYFCYLLIALSTKNTALTEIYSRIWQLSSWNAYFMAFDHAKEQYDFLKTDLQNLFPMLEQHNPQLPEHLEKMSLLFYQLVHENYHSFLK